jgi:hypothetical protein
MLGKFSTRYSYSQQLMSDRSPTTTEATAQPIDGIDSIDGLEQPERTDGLHQQSSRTHTPLPAEVTR